MNVLIDLSKICWLEQRLRRLRRLFIY